MTIAAQLAAAPAAPVAAEAMHAPGLPVPDDRTAAAMFTAHRLDDTSRHLAHADERMTAAKKARGQLRGYHAGHVARHIQAALHACHDLAENLREHYPAEGAELGDLTAAVGLARDDGPDMTKAEARYTPDGGTPAHRCGVCTMYREPAACTLVIGDIDGGRGVCAHFDAAAQLAGTITGQLVDLAAVPVRAYQRLVRTAQGPRLEEVAAHLRRIADRRGQAIAAPLKAAALALSAGDLRSARAWLADARAVFASIDPEGADRAEVENLAAQIGRGWIPQAKWLEGQQLWKERGEAARQARDHPPGAASVIADAAAKARAARAAHPPAPEVPPAAKRAAKAKPPPPAPPNADADTGAGVGSQSPAARKLAGEIARGLRGHPDRNQPHDGAQADTTILDLDDNGKVVVKRGLSDDEWDAEELASYVGQAIGANVDAVARNPAGGIVENFLSGKTMGRFIEDGGDDYAVYHSDAGKRIGLLDWLVDNGDRNEGNSIIAPDGQPWAIDHSLAGFDTPSDPWSPYYGAFSAPAQSPPFGPGKQPLPDGEIDQLAGKLSQVMPEFARLGRLDWYATVLANLADLRSAPPDWTSPDWQPLAKNIHIMPNPAGWPAGWRQAVPRTGEPVPTSEPPPMSWRFFAADGVAAAHVTVGMDARTPAGTTGMVIAVVGSAGHGHDHAVIESPSTGMWYLVSVPGGLIENAQDMFAVTPGTAVQWATRFLRAHLRTPPAGTL